LEKTYSKFKGTRTDSFVHEKIPQTPFGEFQGHRRVKSR